MQDVSAVQAFVNCVQNCFISLYTVEKAYAVETSCSQLLLILLHIYLQSVHPISYT